MDQSSATLSAPRVVPAGPARVAWRLAALAAGAGLAAFVAAAAGSGPVGVPNWNDDRTVFVFAVEPRI
jgi:hypothetical protein